jgi:hypothetical protein
MNRRKFLSGSLAAGAAAAASGLRFGREGHGLLTHAQAAPPSGLLGTPYPTVVIMLHGGLDPAMHLLAVPNGTYGTRTFVNRMSGTSGIKTTTSGLRYFMGSVAAPGKADFEPHIPDIAMLRAFRGAKGHESIAMAWYGQYAEARPATPRKMPWAHYIASKFRAAGTFVPKPCALVYPDQDINVEGLRFLNFAAYGNQSPDPSVAVERVLSWDNFFDSLSATGLPPYARQSPVYGLAGALDGKTYSGAQGEIRSKFDSANSSANNVLKTVFGSKVWPAPQTVRDALGVTATSLGRPLRSKDTQFSAFFTFAYQALLHNLSHVIGINSYGIADTFGFGSADANLTWDTHSHNYQGQIALGQEFWPALGKFIALLKTTDSLVVPGKKLFDTTNIWIQSDMGRDPQTQADGSPEKEQYRSGTQHWTDTHALFLGGRFKRGKVIGDFAPNYYAKPIDLVTGGSGNVIANFDHLVATVIKASGVDPSGYTNAPPIDALVDMSL